MIIQIAGKPIDCVSYGKSASGTMEASPLGKLVKEARTAIGLSQSALAARLGVDGQTISNLETGRTRGVRLGDMKRLADAIQVDLPKVVAAARPASDEVKLAGAADIKGRGTGHQPARPDHAISNTDAVKEDEIMPAFESLAAGALSSGDIETLIQSLGDEQRFKVRIRGDSMDDGTQAGYPSGCWVVFSRPAALSEGLTYGKDYLVWANGDESTFKQVVRHQDARQYVILRARNQDRTRYPDQVLHRREVAYIARAVRKDIPIP